MGGGGEDGGAGGMKPFFLTGLQDSMIHRIDS